MNLRTLAPLALFVTTALVSGCGLKYGQNGGQLKNGGSGDKPEVKTTSGTPSFAKAKEDEDYQALAKICANEDSDDQEAACKLAKSHAKHELGMGCPAKSLTAELTDEETGAASPMRAIYQKSYRKEYLDKMSACNQWDIVFKGAIVAAEPDDYDRFVADGKDVIALFEKWVDTHANLGSQPAEAPKKDDAYPLGYMLSWLARNNASALAPKVVNGAKGAPLYVKLSVIKFAQAVKYTEGAVLARDLLDDADATKRAKGCQLLADMNDTQSYNKVKALSDADPTQVRDKGTVTFPVRSACLAAATKLDPKNQAAPPPGGKPTGSTTGTASSGQAGAPPPPGDASTREGTGGRKSTATK